MGLLTFLGGIHPHDGKNLSKDKAICDYLPKGDGVYPLSQHIGAPAVPLVKKGDYVLVGQKIAEAGGFVSANIHSGISGTVKAIEPRMTVSGVKVESIVIENDGLFEEIDFKKNGKNPAKLKKQEIKDMIKEAGIVGMGGAGFPAHVKLSPKNEDEIDTIIVNGAECEPYLTSDYRRMMETPEEIVEGLKIVLRLFEKGKGIIAIEDNKPDAIKILKELTKNVDNITVNALKTKYPQGAERQLIYANTGREINSSMLPADAGCIVHNIDTIVAIYHAVVEGKPLFERIVTITGDALKDTANFRVRLGTNARELIEEVGGFNVEYPQKIISGGPMMGKAMFDLDVPIVKGSSALLCFKEDIVSEIEESNCIRCGRCSEACPSGILPYLLSEVAKQGNIEEFVQKDGMECCECGCCSYVCPAKRPLTQTIASTRKQVLANKKR